MKICAIICEYNPLHNGHRYLIEKAKAISGADAIVCIMSGDYTQRGEIAVLDKYARARHAILSGADAVIELPTVFATASAEFFSRGAIKLISGIPSVKDLAFGCENDDTPLIQKAAAILSDEPKDFKAKLRGRLKSGESFVKARSETLSEVSGVPLEVLTGSNNILAFEYAKAINFWKANINLLPIKRMGAAHADGELHDKLSSAGAIRENLFSKDRKKAKLIKASVPPYVYEELKQVKENNFKQLAVYSLITRSTDELKEILDCTEGLENRFKALLKDAPTYDELLNKMTSKRYTAARLRRIMLASFLNINEKFIASCMNSELYLKILAVKKGRAEELLSAISASAAPVITRKSDFFALKRIAVECFKKDTEAAELYAFITGVKTNEFLTLFVE